MSQQEDMVAHDAGHSADVGVTDLSEPGEFELEPQDGAENGADNGASDEGPSIADLEFEGEIAADYIEGLLDVADLDGDIDMDVEGERAFVSVVGATLDELVGSRGEVLEALQELTRLAVHRQTGNRTRMMLDVGGYRQRRRSFRSRLRNVIVTVRLRPHQRDEERARHNLARVIGDVDNVDIITQQTAVRNDRAQFA